MVLRLGLCCLFREYPIKFRLTTAKQLEKLEKIQAGSRLSVLGELILSNVKSLKSAIIFCSENGIGCFRVTSQFWPCYTHPTVGYQLEMLPQFEAIEKGLGECKELARSLNIRLTMHPDQFVVLNSPRPEVVKSSLKELEYQARLGSMIGMDVMNIHAGGAYGNKQKSLEALALGIDQLSPTARKLLTLENDDKSYTPADLIPFCLKHDIPFVYDVHHHRCTDGVKNVTEEIIEKTTEESVRTWEDREPLFHISSPIMGWNQTSKSAYCSHHDFINFKLDFPECWKSNSNSRSFTLEVEAKAKELAIAKLKQQLLDNGVKLWSNPSQSTAFKCTLDTKIEATETHGRRKKKDIREVKKEEEEEEEEKQEEKQPISRRRTKKVKVREVKEEEEEEKEEPPISRRRTKKVEVKEVKKEVKGKKRNGSESESTAENGDSNGVAKQLRKRVKRD